MITLQVISLLEEKFANIQTIWAAAKHPFVKSGALGASSLGDR